MTVSRDAELRAAGHFHAAFDAGLERGDAGISGVLAELDENELRTLLLLLIAYHIDRGRRLAAALN